MKARFDVTNINYCQRPVYTVNELSNLVKNKRGNENLSQVEFAKKYDIDLNILEQIEDAKQSFDPDLYIECCKILDMSIEEITKVEKDDINCASYRADMEISELHNIISMANYLFNEIIMQKRIKAN